MIKEAVATGATIEEAQKAALLALNAPLSADVQFEVITFPEKKKFGLFGGKDAEVKAYYEAEDEQETGRKPVKGNTAKKKEAPTKSEEKKEAGRDASKENATPSKKAAPEPKKILTPISIDLCPESVQKAYKYLGTMIDGIGVNGTSIEVMKDEGTEFFFNISSEEDYSLLIGRRGETLDSIQYLVRLVANRGKDEATFSKISVNIGNYRQKREDTLKEIARKTAGKVKRYGRSVALDPMNPFERRIIHTEVSGIDDVISYSVGSDSDRKVIIALADGAKPTQSRRPYGGNNRDRGGYGNRGRGGRPDNRNRESRAIDAPSRAPRSDAEGLSRYGKIESPKAEPKAEVSE